MLTIKEKVIVEQVIKNSRFITLLAPALSVEEANTILNEVKAIHKDATHNCFSYIIGKNQSVYKVSDDGEPSKTAGMPIFEVLKKNQLTNILCVVSRYFGGIKLGAGGLIRAYSSSAAQAVKSATLEEIIEYGSLRITYAYEYHNVIVAKASLLTILDISYAEQVTLALQIPHSEIATFQDDVVEITKNQIKIEVL